MKIVKGKQIDYCVFPQWEWPWLIHGITTKKGGLSQGYLAETNMKEHPEEEQSILHANRQLFRNEFSLNSEELFYGEQVHGNKIAVLDANSQRYLPGVDGIFTSNKGVNLMAFFADCLPLFFLVPRLPAIGLVHAGWRGTLLNIAGQAVNTIKNKWDLETEDILIGFGPSIGPCCYEVNADIRGSFLSQNKAFAQAFSGSRSGHYRFDLKMLNYIQLSECGIPEGNIINNNLCTACERELFYSHRRDNGLTGRMAALLAIV